MPNRVVVLGCGPTGLAAAQAAVDSGYEVLIASAKDHPSTQYGCQYLHAPIPGYEDVPHTRVGYHINGTPDEYRLKVYGSKWEGKVSPEDFVGEHDAWDIRETYARMWDHLRSLPQVYFEKIEPIRYGIIPTRVYEFLPDKIISTIPAMALCLDIDSHNFVFHTIYANGSRRPHPLEDEVICDGTAAVEWYRKASVFGYTTTEWSREPSNLNGDDIVAVPKPLTHNCDCHREVDRVGRYGRWQKSYLVHQAYPDVLELLK